MVVTAAGVSAGSSILGNISGMFQAAATNRLKAQQLSLQQALASRQMSLAERQVNAALSSQTDAAGNQIVYDPSTNTTQAILSPQQQALQDAIESAQLGRLTIDEPIRQGEAISNAERRGSEGQLAQSLQAQLRDQIATASQREQEAESELRSSRRGAVNQGFDAADRALLRQGTRSGDAGLADAMRKSGTSRAQVIAGSQGTPGLEASAASGQPDFGALYGALAGRAAGIPTMPISAAPASSLSSAIANNQLNTMRGFQGAAGSLGQAGQRIAQGFSPLMGTDFSQSLGISDIGKAVAGFFTGADTGNTNRLRKSPGITDLSKVSGFTSRG